MPEFLAMRIEDIFWARPLSWPLMLAAFAAVLVLSVFLYRRSWGLSPKLRVTLCLVRLLVLAAIVAILLEPTAVVRESHTQMRGLPVLIDVSESMSIMDPRKRPEDIAEAATALGLLDTGTSEDAAIATLALGTNARQAIAAATRLDLARTTLTNPGRPVFESLGEALDVSYHAFGGSHRLIRDASTITAADLSHLKATDPATSIAASLEAVTRSGGTRPAAIVLLSDGNDNASSQRSEAVLQDLGARGIPVFTIPVGLTDPDDVSIRNIVMQEVAFSGDRVPIRVQLESKGYEKRTTRLNVMLNGRRVAQREVRFDGGLQFEDIDFRVDLHEKGAARVEITIEPFDDEVSASNNHVERGIRVVNEKINVLYIEGNARWEFRYLEAILKRDPRINATFIASAVGPELARNSIEHIERFPSKRDQAFQYDLVILGDVPADFFTTEELDLLEELIRDRGGSLLMLCGPMDSPTSYAGTAVERMLPVRFDPVAPWEEVSESAFPVLTPEGRSSLVMTLENDPEENDHIWSRVAPLDQLPPLLGPKPGATVLVTLSETGGAQGQGYPLVAWQRYGTGKCLTVATDRLWRLRFNTGDKYHWRVWSQTIQFLTLSRLMGEHKRIRLETDRAIYPHDGQARLYAHVLDVQYEPIVTPGFQVVVNSVDGAAASQRVTLRPARASPGLYEGYFTPPAAGRYRLESTEDDAGISNTTEFQVTTINPELAETAMRLDHLQRIATLTGGATLSARDLPKLAALINREPVTTTVRSERPLWDSPWLLILLIALLGGEWILRRRNDLT